MTESKGQQNTTTAVQPPVFTYTEENFDLDFGLLSEYMAEDEKNAMGGYGPFSSYGMNFADNANMIDMGQLSDNDGMIMTIIYHHCNVIMWIGYSSDEDGGGKRKRFASSDKPRSKEQIDRRR